MKRSWSLSRTAIILSAILIGCQEKEIVDPGQHPSVVSLFAINGDGAVTLGWTPWIGGIPDEIDVHRSSSPTFVPSAQTIYATIPGNATEFQDVNVVNGSYYYYRIAVKSSHTGLSLTESKSNLATGRPFEYDTVSTIHYDEDIQALFNSSCAVHGCHVGYNDTTPDGLSKTTHGGQFSLKSWNDLFYGSANGAVVIPFASYKSDLIFHVNSDTLLTLSAMPHMPLPGFNIPPSQVEALIHWIDEGAKNAAGDIPYSVTPMGKVVVVCAAEDLLAVIDVQSGLLIRYIKVGKAADPSAMFGSPHHVKVDKQGLHFYVTLINSQQLLKFSASTYELEGSLSIPFQPADLALTSTGDSAYVTSFGSTQGLVTLVDTRQMTILRSITAPFASNPHGIVLAHDGSRIFVGNAGSGNITMIHTSDYSTSLIALDTLGNPFQSNVSPYLIDLTPDDRYLFVTDYASGGKNVYVVDLLLDPTKPSHVVPIGGRSVHITVSPDGSTAWVCNITNNSVHVINTSDFSVRTISNVGEQPHGVIFTPDGSTTYITTENTFSPDPPHHPTSGGLGVSYVYVIDTETFGVLRRVEVGAVSQGLAFAP